MRIKVNIGQIGEVIKRLELFEKKLKTKQKEFLQKLGELGVAKGEENFSQIEYAGDYSDKNIHYDWVGENRIAISFESKAILFIEFGTGVYFPSPDHPLSVEFGFSRGGYGQGRGKNSWWVYPATGANAGTPGASEVFEKSRNQQMLITHGNRANRVVYDTGKFLREQIMKIAKEVFRFD